MRVMRKSLKELRHTCKGGNIKSKISNVLKKTVMIEDVTQECESCGEDLRINIGEMGYDPHVRLKKPRNHYEFLFFHIFGTNDTEYYCLDCINIPKEKTEVFT